MWRQTLTALDLALRISAVIITTTIGVIILGILVDRNAGTSPFGVLCFMVIGVSGGTIAIYQLVTKSFPRPPGPPAGGEPGVPDRAQRGSAWDDDGQNDED